MQLLLYLFTGAAALVTSGGAVGVALASRTRVGRDAAILLTLWAMAMWALFSMASFDVVVLSGGEVFSRRYPAWGFVAAGIGVSLVLVLYHLAFGTLAPERRERDRGALR